jgi:hypothetical protein
MLDYSTQHLANTARNREIGQLGALRLTSGNCIEDPPQESPDQRTRYPCATVTSRVTLT